jgi:hypothetical protein
MLALPDLSALLASSFGIPRTPRALGKSLAELGIRPSDIWLDKDSYAGRVGYYDPLVCWALLVDDRAAEPRAVLRDRFAECLVRASDAVWRDYGGDPASAPTAVANEWQWRVQSTAVHLFISDPRHGLSPLDVVELRHAKLHRHTLDSPTCLRDTLILYTKELRALLAVNSYERAAQLISDAARTDREDRVLASLDAHGVLRACDRRLGRAPCAGKK